MAKKLCVYLDAVQISHLYNLVESNEEEGVYSGPQSQYWQRSKRIMVALNTAVSDFTAPTCRADGDYEHKERVRLT